jgi:uncharacterized protein (DUF1501 family)
VFKTTRRGFMVGCSAAIASFTGGLSFTAFGSAEAEPNQEIVVTIFLRGGMDGINVVPPIGGNDRGYYQAMREDIAVPTTGEYGALPLAGTIFGLHPGAAPLHDLFVDKKLAIVHAAGLTSDTRSHFDAMQYMELGTPDSKSISTGWLTRHLQSATNLPSEVIMPVVATGGSQPASLLSSREAISMTTPNDFSLGGHWRHGDNQQRALREMYSASGSWLHQAGVQTLDAVDVVELANPGTYTPANGAIYPNNGFGRNLQTVAQVIKMQLGLRVATVDLGGWDTHEYQGDQGQGYFFNQLRDLSNGINAFMTDLSNDAGVDHTKRVTMVVMSEFGRTFKQNESRGTDHGHGNVMFVIGGNVNGGKVYGDWPGMAPDALYDGRDLQITTDYRRVLSEVLIRRLGNNKLGQVFPGYSGYAPLGVVAGTDLSPDYTGIVLPTPTPGVSPTPYQGPLPNKQFLPDVLNNH